MSVQPATRDALEILKAAGRTVLYRHFRESHGRCIPAARMAYQLCKSLEVECEVQSVVVMIRNKQAVAEDVWPFHGLSKPYRDGTPGIAVLVLGVDGPGMQENDMGIHVVPVIEGQIVDMTLDRSDMVAWGIYPLPTITVKAPQENQLVRGALPLDMDITYMHKPPDSRYLLTPYWRNFWLEGGALAVAELIKGA